MAEWISNHRSSTVRMGVRIVCFVLCVIFILPISVFATERNDHATVRVAVINYPNYIQMNENKIVSGYAFEYLQDIQKMTGWQYEYVKMSFDEAVVALENGEIDILPGNQYTEDRAKLFDYSERDMGEGGSVLCVMPDDDRYCYNDYASYDGLKIAALKGTVRMEQTRQFLEKYGVKAVFAEYDTDDASKQALENGEVDAVLMSTIRCESKYKILARINTAKLFFCTNKKRPELKTALDDAMEQIHLNAPYYEEKLEQKYYGSISVQLAFSQEEKEFIASSGEIVVAVSDDLTPVEYFNDEKNIYCGIVPDSFKLIAEQSGLHFRFVSRKDTQTIENQMQTGKVQLIASVANDAKIAGQWDVTLTEPYFNNSVSLISKSSYNRSDATGVAALCAGYPYLEQIAQLQGCSKIICTDSFRSSIDAVQNGQADFALIPSSCADTLIRNTLYKNMSTYTIPETYMDYCIGVSKTANPLLVSILNKSIDSISKEQKTELLVQNLAAVGHTTDFREFFEEHKLAITSIALCTVLVLLIGAGYMAVTRQRMNRKLRLALVKADAGNREKTEFLARMSHDMRTPMNGILGLAELMSGETDIAQIKKDLPQLRESGEYLLQLINDVLDVNRIEIGELKLHPSACDEESLFTSIITLIEPEAKKKSIDFTFEKKNIRWKYLMLDEQRVKQIFINLLTNAVKFTPKGGRIEFTMEMISESENEVYDKFVVKDTGIGISEEFLPKLFEPFSQENRSTDERAGTGLGLSIVKKLVELMDGTINVRSKIGEGTEITVFIRFPLAQSLTPEQDRTDEKNEFSLLNGKNILLCEDHQLNAQIATRILAKQGVHVTWAKNGKLGLDAFDTSPEGSFDAILMDIRMPEMDGLTAAREIRTLKRTDAESVPIIAMTANAYDEDIRKSMDAGMNAHLAKPINPPLLYSTLVKLIAGRKK